MIKIAVVCLLGLTSAAFADEESALHDRIIRAQKTLSSVVREQGKSEKPDLAAIKQALSEVDGAMAAIDNKMASDESAGKGWRRAEKGALYIGAPTSALLWVGAVLRFYGDVVGAGLAAGLGNMASTIVSVLFKAPAGQVGQQTVRGFWNRKLTYWAVGATGVTVVVYSVARHKRKALERALKSEAAVTKKMFSDTCKVYDIAKRSSKEDLTRDLPKVDAFCSNLKVILNERM